MLKWSVQRLELHLRYTWKLSRNSSDDKTNLLVTVREGKYYMGQGEAAPNVRYGETPEILIKELESALPQLETLQGADFRRIADTLQEMIPSNAIRFAIESAYIHLQAAKSGMDVWNLLDILPPSPSVATCYTIPVMPPEDIAGFIDLFSLKRFPALKIKVNSESAFDMIEAVAKHTSQPFIIDANEAWRNETDDFLVFCKNLKKRNFPVIFIEQPLPALPEYVNEMKNIKKHCLFTLFADESAIHHPNMALLSAQFHGINVKLMKAGGYTEAIRMLREARQFGLKTMIGCMVETTLGISGGLYLSSLADYHDLDSFMLPVNEPFGLVSENEGRLSLV